MSAEGGSVNASNVNTTESKKVDKPRKPFVERSNVWKHFTKYKDDKGNLRAKFNYCVASYARDDRKNSSTSNMLGHMAKCANNPENSSGGQTTLVNNPEGKVGVFKFDKKNGRKALVEWAVIDELSFNAFEKEGFKRFVRAIQPAFVIPSRVTIARDCIQMYLDEKTKLKASMKKYVHRVCLTTDTWTSLQRINYMCLTAHYIDENWNLQKKVINFCPISSHRGNDFGKALELCLVDWGLKKNIMTVTVDNASSNGFAVQYLIGRMARWGDSCIVEGKWTHVRCVAHILNLIVQDGLKDLGKSVERIRAAVRWVRSSGSRLKEFNKHVKSSQVQCTKS